MKLRIDAHDLPARSCGPIPDRPDELMEDAPVRVGVIDEALEAAAEGGGMPLRLQPARRPRPPQPDGADR